MKVLITTPSDVYGTRREPGDVVEVDEREAQRLVRDGAARVTADELLRHLRGRRLVAPPMAADSLRLRQ